MVDLKASFMILWRFEIGTESPRLLVLVNAKPFGEIHPSFFVRRWRSSRLQKSLLNLSVSKSSFFFNRSTMRSCSLMWLNLWTKELIISIAGARRQVPLTGSLWWWSVVAHAPWTRTLVFSASFLTMKEATEHRSAPYLLSQPESCISFWPRTSMAICASTLISHGSNVSRYVSAKASPYPQCLKNTKCRWDVVW